MAMASAMAYLKPVLAKERCRRESDLGELNATLRDRRRASKIAFRDIRHHERLKQVGKAAFKLSKAGGTITEEATSSDEYDTDMEVEADEHEGLDMSSVSYRAACELLHITPAKKVLEHLYSPSLELKYRSLGPAGAKALATALLHNSNVELLDLEDNGLEGEGAMYLADMLRENNFVSIVNLSKNNLGSIGAVVVGEMLKVNTGITHLNLSENHFRDADAESLALGIEKNERVINMDLSRNGFCEEGAQSLSRAIGNNNSIETLNLSWNHLRRKGAVMLCNGLKRNYCVTTIDLAWNGFAYEGALSLGETLKGNKYLRELNISNNRISHEGAMLIAKGLKENDTLEILHIGYNPLTMTGCLDLVEAVDNPMSVVSYMGFEGIPVNRKLLYMSENIQKTRPFSISHGGLVDSEDILGRRMVLRCDPLKLLIQFLSDKGIRPVDLFRTFDKDNQHRVSREQFIQGLKKAQVPLDDYELERVLNRLDAAKEGKISYQRLVRGVKEQIKLNKAEDRRRKAEEQRTVQGDHVNTSQSLPPIEENRTSASSPKSHSNKSFRPDSASSVNTASSVDVKGSTLFPDIVPDSSMSRSTLPRIETDGAVISHKPTPDIEAHGGLLGYLAEN